MTAASIRQSVGIADLRALAKRRLPRFAFDYVDGGADAEITLRENVLAFEQVTFRPRTGVAGRTPSLAITVLGRPLALPFILAPVGASRLLYPRGEEVAASSAGDAGTVYVLATPSGCALEDVKAATSAAAFYQLYLIGGRDVATASIARARAAGYAALVVTIDTAVPGHRERDIRNGSANLGKGSPWARASLLRQMLARPRWLGRFLADGGLMNFPNIVLPGVGPMPYADVSAALQQSATTWDDLRWIREAWAGPIVVKGVQTGDDAKRAINAGAQAVVVSNHGGRQLDSVAPALRMLPEVVHAVEGQIEVYMDGGIRRGSDVVKALCLGARAVLVGRAYTYGLAAGGGPGVARAIEILRVDVSRTLTLLGCPSVGELDRSYVEVDWKATRRDAVESIRRQPGYP